MEIISFHLDGTLGWTFMSSRRFYKSTNFTCLIIFHGQSCVLSLPPYPPVSLQIILFRFSVAALIKRIFRRRPDKKKVQIKVCISARVNKILFFSHLPIMGTFSLPRSQALHQRFRKPFFFCSLTVSQFLKFQFYLLGIFLLEVLIFKLTAEKKSMQYANEQVFCFFFFF